MPSVTLVESAKLSQNQLVQGVIESIVTVNPFFEHVPFQPIEGNALAYNRENVLGDVQLANVGDTITAKNAATFVNVTSPLTTIIGDAEVNGLVQATRSNINDQKAVQIASKAKSAGRQYQNSLVNGTGSAPDFTGLLTLVDPARTVGAGSAAANGAVLAFSDLDILLDFVIDKDTEVDYLMMHGRTIRSYMNLLRALPGALMTEVLTLPSGRTVPTYRGIPIFRNDWLPTTQVKGATSTCTSVMAGTFDDGSMSHGIAGLTAKNEYGIQIDEVGVHQSRDETITRVKWYCGLALFSLNGLACLTGVTN